MDEGVDEGVLRPLRGEIEVFDDSANQNAGAEAMPWLCTTPNCETRFKQWCSPCPMCRNRNCVMHRPAHEVPAPDAPEPTDNGRALATDTAVIEKKPRIATGFPSIDAILGGGLVAGRVVLLGGKGGVGKTTAVLEILYNMVGPSVYATGEQSREHVIETAQRIGARSPNLRCAEVQTLQEAFEIFEEHGAKYACIDSINRIRYNGVVAERGSPKMCNAVMKHSMAWARKHDAILFILSHANKDGDFAGATGLQHDADVNMMLTKLLGGDRILRVVKSRIGPDGTKTRLRLDASGALREPLPIEEPPPVVQDAAHGSVDRSARKRAVDDSGGHKRKAATRRVAGARAKGGSGPAGAKGRRIHRRAR